ncbi:MAG: alpha/beta fold hydrolase [Nocardioides sp.]|uniref:alpha/beta fold hydrolase n=1 Tax=Nocardioides sp. TaxID=35761 RepID=UPI003D6AB624
MGDQRTLVQRRQAVMNLSDFLFKRGIADTSDFPSTVVDTGHTRTVKRYNETTPTGGLPVLLVPPLGAQAKCFDLHRGCSYAEHLVQGGRRTYLLDYGAPTFADRRLGLEHYVMNVLPAAIDTVSQDAGGARVNLVGWCMGGLLSLITSAAYPALPINAVAMVASPVDLSKTPLLAPLRAIGKYTDGRIIGSLIKLTGGPPSLVTGLGFKATALPAYLKKPITLWKYRDDRDFLAQVAAVDELMNSMLTYPGRATMQAYVRLAIRNELASGTIRGVTREVHLADVRVPVMNVAGQSDVLVPAAAAHHVARLLTDSPDVRMPIAPGGHLGVLTGPKALGTTWRLIDEFLDAHP